MSITIHKIKMPGVLPGDTNPLPMFKDPVREKPSAYDQTFREKDKYLFAYETGFRVLPYKMQDQYTRNKETLELDVIDLENDCLRARFLPAFGGRLISLYDKKASRELLFSNPVFQPANLATRDAWFSGGIEWNISQFGHSYLTCEPIFFARLTDNEGHEFLRLYEYERNRQIFFSIDFHLPPEQPFLGAHMRIVNDNDHEVPMYWWTNIAVKEEKDIRIFSETDEVIYIKPESNIREESTHAFGRGSLIDMPTLPGKDASMPMNFNFASEYFFQNPEETESPWEAAVYNDGNVFFERSTSPLLYRKMFCWGTHKGGRNWCDFLSLPGQGDYLEIQAGMAPTQLHGMIMPGDTTWHFSQFFGATRIPEEEAYREWKDSRDKIKGNLESLLPARRVNDLNSLYSSYSHLEPQEILFSGSGWGALEIEFRQYLKHKAIPAGYAFPLSTLGEEQKPWLSLLQGEKFDESLSWMTDNRWKKLLLKSVEKEEDNPWPLIHLGVLAYEEGYSSEALQYWQDSLTIKPTALAWRNISVALRDWGKGDQALDALRRAVTIQDNSIRLFIIRELMVRLIEEKLYDEAWKYYKTLPFSEAMTERILIPAAVAAFHKDDREFLEKAFAHPYANIKEGETRLADLWFLYQARLAGEKDKSASEEEHLARIRRELDPPVNIDFTMTERE